MHAKRLISLGLLAASPCLVPAQPADPEALPPVLQVISEQIKPGKMGAHDKQSVAFKAVLAKANPDVYWIGLTPLSGDANLVMYLSGYPSLNQAAADTLKIEAAIAQTATLRAEMERFSPASADVHSSQHTAYFVYRSGYCYRPPKMSEIAQARYMAVTTVKVKPGHVPDYQDYVKTLNAAREKAGVSWLSNSYYQASIGAAAGTFLVFRPLRSLADLDDDNTKADDRQRAIDAALGGEPVVKVRRALIADILVEPSTMNVFSVSREQSNPSQQFAAFDPDFWTPKPAPSSDKALATKKAAPPKP